MILLAAQLDPGWPAKVAVALLAFIAVAFLLDRLGLWMERHGWIYWRKAKRNTGGGGGVGGMLTEFQKLIEPQTEHRIQVMEERRTHAGERAVRGDGVDDATPGAREEAAGATIPPVRAKLD